MSVNIILGAPGSGKSYEAVAFHVLPALAAGRKVITNLSLDVEELGKLDPDHAGLIEKRTGTLAVRPVFDAQKAQSLYQKFGIAAKNEYWNAASFSHVEDYGDPWRHPVTGAGPLYVIDECHLSLPSRGTPVPVEEWFSLHRRESADVLLISQSHRKINRAVIDLVQTCYRVRKNTALGSDKSYRRAVHDGVTGEQANFSIRKYQPHYFKYYSSYTKGGKSEVAASDILPIWRRPIFIVMFLAIAIAIVLVLRAGNPLALGDSVKVKPAQGSASAGSSPAGAAVSGPGTEPAAREPSESGGHPLAGYQVHQVGHMIVEGRSHQVYYQLSRQGMFLGPPITSLQLIEMGYQVVPLEKCFSHIRHVEAGWQLNASCDAPTQSTALSSESQPGAVSGGVPASAGGGTCRRALVFAALGYLVAFPSFARPFQALPGLALPICFLPQILRLRCWPGGAGRSAAGGGGFNAPTRSATCFTLG